MDSAVRILLVSGSTRGASTNTTSLRTAQLVAPDGVEAVMFDGLADLPAFNPDDDREPAHPAVHLMRQQLNSADVVLFCTPEYAGALPGSFKNMIDWTVGSGELHRKPVAWINIAAQGRGTAAYAQLATVLGYVEARVLEPGCQHVPLPRSAITTDGTVSDTDFRSRLAETLTTIAHEFRQMTNDD